MPNFWESIANFFKPQQLQQGFGLPASFGPLPPAPAPTTTKMSDILKSIDATEDRANLADKRVAIIIGHDAMRPGAVLKFGAFAKMSEYVYNSVLAQYIFRRLETLGLDTDKIKIIKRDKIGIAGAYSAAHRFGADFIIELHFNASEASSARGCEVLIGDNSPSAVESIERRFTAVFCQRMIGVFGSIIRHGNGVMEVRREDRGGGNVCAIATIPAVLIEPFFASNVSDCEHFAKDSGQLRLAKVIGDSIADTLLWSKL